MAPYHSSFPRRRESIGRTMDPRFRGGDVLTQWTSACAGVRWPAGVTWLNASVAPYHSSFPRRRESIGRTMDPRFRGGDVVGAGVTSLARG